MKRAFKPLSLLVLLGVALLAPVVLSCATASVTTPDPTPLEQESEEDEEEGGQQGG